MAREITSDHAIKTCLAKDPDERW
jgi:hypothetical protein